MGNGTLDEALLRLHGTGPETVGWLSNHAPMATEALIRNGHADEVDRWLDDQPPRPGEADPARPRRGGHRRQRPAAGASTPA